MKNLISQISSQKPVNQIWPSNLYQWANQPIVNTDHIDWVIETGEDRYTVWILSTVLTPTSPEYQMPEGKKVTFWQDQYDENYMITSEKTTNAPILIWAIEEGNCDFLLRCPKNQPIPPCLITKNAETYSDERFHYYLL